MVTRVSAGLRRSPVFFGVVSVLLLLTAVNLYWFRYDFSALAHGALQRDDSGVVRWQEWARHYDRLFSMLPWGERVGIQLEGSHSSGIVLERTGQGMVARRSLFLRSERPGVILIFAPKMAEKLLGTVPQGDPEAIWALMKDALYGRQITVWSDPDVDRLQRGGYLAFLRAIDTRPASLDWREVKIRLGERRASSP